LETRLFVTRQLIDYSAFRQNFFFQCVKQYHRSW